MKRGDTLLVIEGEAPFYPRRLWVQGPVTEETIAAYLEDLKVNPLDDAGEFKLAPTHTSYEVQVGESLIVDGLKGAGPGRIFVRLTRLPGIRLTAWKRDIEGRTYLIPE